MTSLYGSVIFRLKLAQVILSLGCILPIFCNIYITSSIITADIVHLTYYSYLGIGIIVLVSMCIAEPVSEKVALYSSILAIILHLVSAVFVIRDLFLRDHLWGLRLISGTSCAANAAVYGWEILLIMKFLPN